MDGAWPACPVEAQGVESKDGRVIRRHEETVGGGGMKEYKSSPVIVCLKIIVRDYIKQLCMERDREADHD